jgi:hypothetical protein
MRVVSYEISQADRRSAFTSKLFKFIVGDKQTVFNLHADIIAKQSKALDVLINGPMSEALVGGVTFDDVDEGTFERFCQFAYHGDYATPECTGTAPPQNTRTGGARMKTVVDGPEDDDLEDDAESQAETAGKSDDEDEDDTGLSKAERLRELLDEKDFDTSAIDDAFTSPCMILYNEHDWEDYTPVFLGHARLYVFADKWGITNLKSLTLSNLHETITEFTLYSKRRTDIVELLRCTYSNDHTPDRICDEVDALRALVMLFIGVEIDSMSKCPEFLGLIEEGGECASDLVKIMMQRI